MTVPGLRNQSLSTLQGSIIQTRLLRDSMTECRDRPLYQGRSSSSALGVGVQKVDVSYSVTLTHVGRGNTEVTSRNAHGALPRISSKVQIKI